MPFAPILLDMFSIVPQLHMCFVGNWQYR